MNYYQTLKVSLIPATNTKGTRVKIESLNNSKTLILPYDHFYNGSREIAVNYLNSKGIEIFGISSLDKFYLLFVDPDFEL